MWTHSKKNLRPKKKFFFGTKIQNSWNNILLEIPLFSFSFRFYFDGKNHFLRLVLLLEKFGAVTTRQVSVGRVTMVGYEVKHSLLVYNMFLSKGGFDILTFCHFYILRFWDFEILRFWDFEILRFWDFEILRFWDFEILRFWDFEILRFWDFEILRFWDFEILRFWDFEILTFWHFDCDSDIFTTMSFFHFDILTFWQLVILTFNLWHFVK
jgi:hypothetical protein